MNKGNLKNYAPRARLDFIAAVTARAHLLGITAEAASAVERSGDVAIIEGREWPAKIISQREKLLARISRHGFDHSMEEVAYTWFNRFVALRFMEIHDYLGHGWRVLSSKSGGAPEILAQAGALTLSGLDQGKSREMLLAGNQDNELYRVLIIAQCNQLSSAIPFLFERIDDDTELLLPTNLLRTDSILAKLVAAIPDEDWSEIEIIGWLYQFYISAKKDLVMGSIVKSEDIPAATQLFTPNWIVKFLVQNSLGKLWTLANPGSLLRAEWPMLIEPAGQTPAASGEIAQLIAARLAEDGGTLNPEGLSILDPACGSGHILLVAYDALKCMYLERGYQSRSIPRLILEKNLFGLDIDDRAAQLAGFALLMKARADDRRLLDNPPNLNIISLKESGTLKVEGVARELAKHGVAPEDVQALAKVFEHAKTFGSLTKIPAVLGARLPRIRASLSQALQSSDLFACAAAGEVAPLAHQAWVMAKSYDAVVANPPYMGFKGMNPLIKEFARIQFPDSKSDLFAMFIERGFAWCKEAGFISMVTMQSWMFLSSYQAMREKLLAQRTINAMAHLGPRAFSEISGEVVQTTAFAAMARGIAGYKPTFFRLVSGNEEEKADSLLARRHIHASNAQDVFARIPGSPLAYWASDQLRQAFATYPALAAIGRPRQGLATSDNSRFLRLWHEVAFSNVGISMTGHDEAERSGRKWFPCQKGGGYRRWYGNNEHVVNWYENGKEIKAFAAAMYGSASKRIANERHYFKTGISWSTLSSAALTMRQVPAGQIFETKGAMCFFDSPETQSAALGVTNSKIVNSIISCISPTLDFHEGPVGTLPIATAVSQRFHENVATCVALAKADWDMHETSWDFARSPLVGNDAPTLEAAWDAHALRLRAAVARMQQAESENNAELIALYGLAEELTPDVAVDEISLAKPDRERDAWRLVSYAIGCMLGRYSLDQDGLACGGGGDFAPEKHSTYQAEASGILPIMDGPWFGNDAAVRVKEFLRRNWGQPSLNANMDWLAQSLGAKAGEDAEQSIRRHVSERFYKEHVQTYRKRPIYWLFSSGKQRAFQALIYLHRYDGGTLARMRSEYVVPLSAKFASRLEGLADDMAASGSAAERSKLRKQVETLRKKQTELIAFDEKLRHLADMRIPVNLDDGVKSNYAQFGDLLAESRSIVGGADE